MADSLSNTSDVETELTMCDVLEEEQELEEDANAVLGGSDDKNCSYDRGYVPRQALYACMTCRINGEAGICLACCYACHDGHEVVELYTKRNFRCDCGNSKFTDKECSLKPDKDPLNSDNKYNQNFKGLYCSCSRPYPDLEDSTPDEMIQCIFCEDWYHGRHLGIGIPKDYFEMICSHCMESHPFLFPYLNSYEVNVNVDDSNHAFQNNTDCSPTKPSEKGSTQGDNSNADSVKQTTDSELSGLASASDNKTRTAENCILEELKNNIGRSKGAAFWPENWRKDLCQCSLCLAMYHETECEFLLNIDDTIQAYEEKGKGNGSESQYDKGMSALSQMDRVKQMEAIHAYTNMKGQLKEYLKEFADNKRTVRESDIKDFFEGIKKKQKVNNGIPHFCR